MTRSKTSSPCLSDETLKQLATGDLPPATVWEIEAHVDEVQSLS